MKHLTGELGWGWGEAAGSLSPCRLLQYDKAVISVICNSFAYSTMMVYSGGSLGGKKYTTEMYLFLYASERLDLSYSIPTPASYD